jgi:hypothetical protein
MNGTIDDGTDFALTWTIEEPMARSSHALVEDGRVWIVDPVDWAPALERVAALGEPAAVVQLLDRHSRDAAAIAARLRVPHLKVPSAIAESPFKILALTHRRWWKESALWWPARRTLVVPEAIGTAPAFAVGTGAAGVHPALRLLPPRRLRSYAPAHLLVGHGPALHYNAATALAVALDDARTDVPRLLAQLPSLIRSARS